MRLDMSLERLGWWTIKIRISMWRGAASPRSVSPEIEVRLSMTPIGTGLLRNETRQQRQQPRFSDCVYFNLAHYSLKVSVFPFHLINLLKDEKFGGRFFGGRRVCLHSFSNAEKCVQTIRYG